MQHEVAVIGAGVVGASVALALARHGVDPILVEAEPRPGLAASGTNSGILHTGFDSKPDELETALILRSARLREPLLAALGVPVLRCGAELRPVDAAERERVRQVAEGARANGVPVDLRDDGVLEVPGEAVTDPVAYTLALVAAAERLGARVRTGAAVTAIRRSRLAVELDDGELLGARVVVNCAGLHADRVARMAGDDSFEIYPRKGEFLVFDPPADDPLDRILLPVPTDRTKGVLVFPTLDGHVVAGPTAIDCEDKGDWSVRPQAAAEILPKAVAMYPPLGDAKPVAAYAGLRPAGRGSNYVIGPSPACLGLVNVAAIRSTGLTASLGIAEHVTRIVAELGVALGERRPVDAVPPPVLDGPWWQRTARHRAGRRG